MKRRAPLPPHLAPWFALDPDGVVRCRRCAATFVGTHRDNLSLARHVSVHVGKRTNEGRPGAPVESGQG